MIVTFGSGIASLVQAEASVGLLHDARTLRCSSLMAHTHKENQYRVDVSEWVGVRTCLQADGMSRFQLGAESSFLVRRLARRLGQLSTNAAFAVGSVLFHKCIHVKKEVFAFSAGTVACKVTSPAI